MEARISPPLGAIFAARGFEVSLLPPHRTPCATEQDRPSRCDRDPEAAKATDIIQCE
jgi:hypothetical protein